MKIFNTCILVLLVLNSFSQSTVLVTTYERTILTHSLIPTGPIPAVFDPNGVYPYLSYSETANRPVPVSYRFIALENDFIKVTICPDLGGKVTSIIHKTSGREVLYVPDVIRPTRILPRFYFVAGGIEVSFPISHSPSQNEKVLYKIEHSGDRAYLTCGERELRFGMQWSVEYSLGPEDQFLTERVKLHNPGTQPYPWMSWSNAAVPSAPDTRFYFPQGTVLSHSSVIDTIDWKTEGPQNESDIKEMTGYFWITRNANAFGVFTPSFGSGLYHVAEENISPGMKLWSYGTGSDRSWATLSTAKTEPYIEVQGGPIGDQSIKLELKPDETRYHVEFWFPAEKEMDIYKLKVPVITLRSHDSIPLFGWARPETVDFWKTLKKSFKEQDKVPELTDLFSYPPPSGMEDLKTAFEWTVKNTATPDADKWKYYYGTWLAGRGDTSQAIDILTQTSFEMAKPLLARLLRLKGDNKAAAAAYRSINERWLQLHPQVVIERDKVLRSLGSSTIKEREDWLLQVNALPDEWLIERRVQLLIDKGEPEKAKELLLSVPFQKVHQTYSRTNMWFQICDMLKESHYPIPEQLGEDRLATFGAYREFE
ncbi:MAG TPA: DUF5107 domain-containing protein [Bacteroidales bacterium]|nr:DUF5107 domain-containing protein [Bacteroidales bacterium]